MNTRIFRFVSPVHFYSPSPLSPLRVSLLLIHSVAGGAALPRRPDLPPRLPRAFCPTHSFSSSSKKHHEEDGRDVKVAVWWDFENCSIPAGVNVFLVAQRITSALRSNGIKGPVTITAFGDALQLSRTSQEALTSTGVCLTHVPRGGKNSSDKSFMADLVYWISQNPPPVHFFLISGDKDFANILHRLRMSNYNILLASRESTPAVLCSAATMMWSWACLVKGNNATAKHFNHPPDGLYGSWYGHHKNALDDPFSEMEQANGKGEESVELSAESKPRPIPKVFVNAIRQILHSYPEGINMSDLRNELKRINVNVDRDFFGYKKFSHILTSMPSILKFIPSTSLEGQPLVVSRHFKAADSSPMRSKTTQDFDQSVGEVSHTPKQDGKSISVAPNNDVGHTPLTPDSPANQEEIDSDNNKRSSRTHRQYGVNEGGVFQNFKRYFFRFQQLKEPSSLCAKENNAEANHDVSTSKQRKNIFESRFLQRIWVLMNHPSTNLPAGRIASISGLDSTSNKDSGEAEPTCDVIEKLKCEDKKTNWKNKFSPSKIFREVSESPETDKTTGHSDMQTFHPETKQNFFKRIAGWWSKKSEKDQEAVLEPGKEVINKCTIVNQTPPLDVFSKGYFWDALESFLLTSKGAELISKSRTRDQVVHGLQKEGPWVLKDLSKAQLLDLVNLMITEKKWINVSIFQTFPFKLTFNEQKCVTSHSYNSNGLSSLFTAKISKASTQRQPEQKTSDHKSGLMGSSFTETTSANQPQNFVEFKAWFQKAYRSKEDLQPEDLEKMFESIFSIKVVPSSYGYPDLQSLIAACLSDDNHKKTKSSPSREKILSDCRKLLIELFDEYPDGFLMSTFKPAFLQKYSYVLSCQTLGYPKLASLLEIMPGVRIESNFVLPAERFLSDSSFTNQPTQDDKVDTSNSTDPETAADDCAWEELGPVHETVACGDLTAAPIKDKELTYDEASLSDDEFSDPEEVNTPQLQDPEGKSGRCREESSLIQILDSWYGNKEGGEKSQAQGCKGVNHNEQARANQEGGQRESSKDGCETEQVGDAAVLVDCSKDKPENLNDVKPKLRFRKRFSFVSDSKDDKEKLVDSILGSLKKSGNSKLAS
ncbi:uncharacterized protein LOC122005289 [Zingiber officinale]|uniref:uncharacterized protein LOC122005289 n=1 Tax=Zingiber officinale TaxID=94328 RepID=UPI001C4BCA7C|nr:uncharacterized protein LOC122005289 [Zingiber officinale]